jgi:cell division protein FtsQ
VASGRTPRKFPYRTGITLRPRRVVKVREQAARGVQAVESPRPFVRVTPHQARMALALSGVVMLVAAAWYAYHSPWLSVREVEVSGALEVSPERVRQAAALDGDSIFSLDLAAAEARVEQLPKVRDAVVERAGRNGVSITVEERTAWGSWRIDGVDVPIDAEGYVLDGTAPPGSPVIEEIDAQRAINAGERIDPAAVEAAVRITEEAETAFGRRVLSLLYRRNSGLTAVLSGVNVNGKGVWAIFGDSRDYEYKVASLYVLLQQAESEGLALTTVDLRFGDRLSFN